MTRSPLLLTAVWLALVLALVARSERRDAAPGPLGQQPGRWPGSPALTLADEGLTLVLLLHPRCPCSVASVEELERLLRDVTTPVRAYALVVVPVGAPRGFADDAECVARDRAVPGLGVVLDPDGREAARFDARTSGHVAVYDAAGALRFTGGLTPGRGRRGDGPGRLAVLSLSGASSAAPVFGCSLQEESR